MSSTPGQTRSTSSKSFDRDDKCDRNPAEGRVPVWRSEVDRKGQNRGKRIMVLGVGNILFTDEGRRRQGHRAPRTHVRVFRQRDALRRRDARHAPDGQPILECELLIVVDAVLGDGPPGTLYRLTGEGLRQSLAFKNSLHQTDLVDTLIYCELLGNRPDAVVIGIEPQDFRSMSVSLSPVLAASMERIVRPSSMRLPPPVERGTETVCLTRSLRCVSPCP
jgi:hydrogenase maturation protease